MKREQWPEKSSYYFSNFGDEWSNTFALHRIPLKKGLMKSQNSSFVELQMLFLQPHFFV